MIYTVLLLLGAMLFAFLAWEYAPRLMRPLAWLLVLVMPACVITRAIMLPRADMDTALALMGGNDGGAYVPIVRGLTLMAAGAAMLLMVAHCVRGIDLTRLNVMHPVLMAVAFLISRWLVAGYSAQELITPSLFYAPILVMGWWVASVEFGPAWMRWYWLVLASLIVTCSLTALVVAPVWARGGEYTSTLMGDPRLFGIMDHPSTLFPFALFLIYLASLMPLSAKQRWILGLGALLCVLLTNNVTALICLAALVAYTVVRLQLSGRLRIRLPTILGITVLVVVGGVVGHQWASDLQIGSISATRVSSFSGRNEIWPVAMQAIVDEPWFGHGLEAFRIHGFAMKYRLVAAHAHSQYLDVLVQGGMFHALFLVLMLASFICWAARMTDGLQRQIAICLVIIILVRGLTERPLDFGLVNGGLLFFLAVITFMQPDTPPRRSVCNGLI